jgi:hypothetical protein
MQQYNLPKKLFFFQCSAINTGLFLKFIMRNRPYFLEKFFWPWKKYCNFARDLRQIKL